MDYEEIEFGLYKNLKQWIDDFDVSNKIFRYWDKDNRRIGTEAQLVYLSQWIFIGNDWLVGIQLITESDDGEEYEKLEQLRYKKLSEIYFEYHDEDQSPHEEE